MDYQKIYKQLLEKVKCEYRIKNTSIYYEKHHIVPKCLGGNNSKDNLVLLTAREHFICHKLLCEIYTDNIKLQHAFWRMCCIKNNNQRNYFISNREYEVIRIKIKELTSIRFKGNTPWNKGLTKKTSYKVKFISNKLKKIPRTPEWNNNISITRKNKTWEEIYGIVQSQKLKNNRSVKLTGSTHSKSTILKMRKKSNTAKVKEQKLKNNPMWRGDVYIYNPNGELFNKFNSINETVRILKCKVNFNNTLELIKQKGKFKGYKFILINNTLNSYEG